MLNGIIKAAVMIGTVVLADQYLADGIYTDAALSMLSQMAHSFR